MADSREYVIRWADERHPTHFGLVIPHGDLKSTSWGAPSWESYDGDRTADDAERDFVTRWTSRNAEVYRLDWTATPPSLVRVG